LQAHRRRLLPELEEALREQGYTEAALVVGERVLALKAALVAFHADPNLASYLCGYGRLLVRPGQSIASA
jgi:hypothetical protein